MYVCMYDYCMYVSLYVYMYVCMYNVCMSVYGVGCWGSCDQVVYTFGSQVCEPKV